VDDDLTRENGVINMDMRREETIIRGRGKVIVGVEV
jgi:hypothetical protein